MSVSPSFFEETRDTTPRGWTLVFAAWLLATTSTLGALFLSEVVGVAPCVLCWYQRVFMFPLVFVLASGLFPLDRRVFRYAFPLAIGGWLVALFHVLLTHGVIPHELSPCRSGIPCSQVEVMWFGFVTIPLLSLVSFTAIVAALVAARFQVEP
jgi:disulfide bond formation protein DsbB